MNLRRLLISGLFATLAYTQPTLAQEPNVTGLWVGKTTCPAGAVSFAIDITGTTGTFSHDGFGKEKQHPQQFPINVRFNKGWEGMWVYFDHADSGQDHASFSNISGLLSSNGEILDVRKSVTIGDCQPFLLTRNIASQQAQQQIPTASDSTSLGPPDKREPSAQEMLAALEYSLYGDSDAYRYNNIVVGTTVKVEDFEKLGCVPAVQKPGYVCDYIVKMDMRLHSNEGSAAGQEYVGAVQNIFNYLQQTYQPPTPATSSRRFLYVQSKGRWVMLSD